MVNSRCRSLKDIEGGMKHGFTTISGDMLQLESKLLREISVETKAAKQGRYFMETRAEVPAPRGNVRGFAVVHPNPESRRFECKIQHIFFVMAGHFHGECVSLCFLLLRLEYFLLSSVGFICEY